MRKQGLYNPQFEHDACGIGFVANIKGQKSNKILSQALTVLKNLDHRGGQGSEINSGDGAGVLLQIPHNFLKKQCEKSDFLLPPAGKYAVGMVFFPINHEQSWTWETVFENIIKEEGQEVLGWREVPTNNFSLGETAKTNQPLIKQVFITNQSGGIASIDFERKLFVIRKRVEHTVEKMGLGEQSFYVTSLSASTIVYKGMLTPKQLAEFYPDLQDPLVETALALVHSRFSTNTFPSWERAHPYRYIVHNGEINTLRGNINWMYARQAMWSSPTFGEDLKKVLPVIDQDGSDSSMFDNCLEFLSLAGRSLPHAAMMMIPEPWEKNYAMTEARKAFYEYHSSLMEPWDGPAAVAFTDGKIIGALLDRNGLRPARYYITKDGLIVLASEAGVLDLDEEDIVSKERLYPGKMLLVDTQQGRIIGDDELKEKIAGEYPYRQWLEENQIALEDLPKGPEVGSLEQELLYKYQQAFGYTEEELEKVIRPMTEKGMEPVSSMGNDTPLAVLSKKPQLLYNYFKQLFAQVTNPPIDAVREEIVTSTETKLGPEHNLLIPGPQSCRRLKLRTPILSNEDLARIKNCKLPEFKGVSLSLLFETEGGGARLKEAIDELCLAANNAIKKGVGIIILSDRGLSQNKVSIPALLALSGVHHHLIRQGTRTKVSLIVETGEARETHHFALLIGYGAGAVNPYLVFDSLKDMTKRRIIKDLDYRKAGENYITAVTKGIVKIMAKMGISTIQSYRSAQIFEALGINQEVIEKYFTRTSSRIGGIGLDIIAKESLERHAKAFGKDSNNRDGLDSGGDFQWRKEEEYHLFNPESIYALQQACRLGDYELYKKYSRIINNRERQIASLRGLLAFKSDRKEVPLEEVEHVDSILKRFSTGAISYGSISKEAHECLAIAMNRIDGRSNSGEGGEEAERFVCDDNGDWRRSAIKQVASGRFGVTSHYLVNAAEIQIKMAQGAKPGEGGHLPGEKVYPWIAKVRNSTPGVELISPPPHHDIYSIEDLAQLIFDVKNANPQARISVKLVSEVGVGTVAAGVAKGQADSVLISGFEGGTGASSRSSIKHAGLPWELGLAEVHQTLVLNKLRDRIVVETDGKLMTGRDVVIATLLGAERYGFATAPMVSLGCVMMRACHLDTCAVGIATQNPILRKNFKGDPQYVVNFMTFVAREMREIMAKLGFRSIDEMVGRTEALETINLAGEEKIKDLDLSVILNQPLSEDASQRYCKKSQGNGQEKTLDRQVLLPACRVALEEGKPVEVTVKVTNTDRAVGTTLGSEVSRRYGAQGLPQDTIRLYFQGCAGQSFGAFIPKGITLSLEGDANDYLGKGLSGGKLILFPPKESSLVARDNIIIGNVALYGTTSGEAYISGIAGERFCVRFSGGSTVVEGVGDHGCEYMTGGRVVVLGRTGRNFAAGMSGGTAYVLDEDKVFLKRCNKEMVLLEPLQDEEEINLVKNLIGNHVKYTESSLGQEVLNNWEEMIPRFVKVIPRGYKKILTTIREFKKKGLSEEDATMATFGDQGHSK